MDKKYRIGLVGLAHNHVWHTLEPLKKSDLGFLTSAAVKETKSSLLNERREKLQEEFGLKKIYSDYHKMIEEETLDAVLAYSENNTHAEITEAAAAHNLHVMVEKPMGARLEDAERMVSAAKKSGIKLMVNWPTAWNPAIQKIYSLIKEGAIGEVSRIRRLSGHAGPQRETMKTFYDWQWMTVKEKNGAGAYMDFCCYGAALCRMILGIPKEVFGTLGNFTKDFLDIDDNGTLIMVYGKAIGISEGSWSQIGNPAGELVIYGDKGTIELIRVDNQEGIKLYTKENRGGKIVELPALSQGKRNGVEYFLTCIKENKPLEGLCSPEVSIDAQEILEAGLISAKKKKAINLPLRK